MYMTAVGEIKTCATSIKAIHFIEIAVDTIKTELNKKQSLFSNSLLIRHFYLYTSNFQEK